MDDRTQREFLADIEELIEQLFEAAQELRSQETLVLRRHDLVARIFRCLHSIKGLAASAGFTAAAELAHQTETALDAAPNGRIEISAEFIDTLEDVANAISEALNRLPSETREPASDFLVQRLRALAAGEADFAGANLSELPAPLAAALSEREKQLLVKSLRPGLELCLVAADFEVANFDVRFQKLRELLTGFGEVVSTLPSAAGPVPNRIGFRLFFISELTARDVQARLTEIPEALVTPLIVSRPPDSPARPGDPDRVPIGRTPLPGHPGFIRLELAELDRLLSSAHEVFQQVFEALDFVSNTLTGEARTELNNLDAQVRQALAVMEEKIGELRLISVNRVFQRAILAGRVAARSAGKEVQFSLVGGDLLIDKLSSDAIASPLIHLVRNAVDHGIETPAERINRGKSPSGTVRLEATANDDEVRFVVADDGRGIDPQVVSAAAAARGLIENDTVLELEESLRLIFHPRFSTARTVTSLSGRGVGLDVVGVSMELVGGSVKAQTWPGKGSAFELCLPRSSAKL